MSFVVPLVQGHHLRDLSHGHDGSYDETTATIQQQTRDLSPPIVKRCDNNVRRRRQQQQRRQQQEGGFDSLSERRQRRRQRQEGIFIVNRNDGNNGGMGLGIGIRRQPEEGPRPISTSDLAYHGRHLRFIPSLYSR